MTVVEELSRRLADGEVVVLDGGMGTELQARGVPMDDEAWSGVANLTHDHIVQEIHEDYIRAGADVIIANTYAAARLPLERAGYGDRVVEANRRAVRAAREARDRVADRPVAIAGSMSLAAAEDVVLRGAAGADRDGAPRALPRAGVGPDRGGRRPDRARDDHLAQLRQPGVGGGGGDRSAGLARRERRGRRRRPRRGA
jgi:hypothetical protein